MQLKSFVTAIVLVPTMAISIAVGQAAHSTLTGLVTDAQERTLQGAQITIDPGNLSATSDAQGLFTVTALQNGAYTITVKYEGFEPLTQAVQLTSGQSAHLDLKMKVASTAQNVEVYAGREGGEIEAINRTLTADNIL